MGEGSRHHHFQKDRVHSEVGFEDDHMGRRCVHMGRRILVLVEEVLDYHRGHRICWGVVVCRIHEEGSVVHSLDHSNHQVVGDDQVSVHDSLAGCNLLVVADDGPNLLADHSDHEVGCVGDNFGRRVVLLESRLKTGQRTIGMLVVVGVHLRYSGQRHS